MQPGPNTSMFIQYFSNQQGSLIDAELKPQYKTDMEQSAHNCNIRVQSGLKPFCDVAEQAVKTHE